MNQMEVTDLRQITEVLRRSKHFEMGYCIHVKGVIGTDREVLMTKANGTDFWPILEMMSRNDWFLKQ